jgi:hypothetical protein
MRGRVGLMTDTGPISKSVIALVRKRTKLKRLLIEFPDRGDIYEAELLVVERKIRDSGACQMCGHQLGDEDSLERGYGPTCWIKILKEREYESSD